MKVVRNTERTEQLCESRDRSNVIQESTTRVTRIESHLETRVKRRRLVSRAHARDPPRHTIMTILWSRVARSANIAGGWLEKKAWKGLFARPPVEAVPFLSKHSAIFATSLTLGCGSGAVEEWRAISQLLASRTAAPWSSKGETTLTPDPALRTRSTNALTTSLFDVCETDVIPGLLRCPH